VSIYCAGEPLPAIYGAVPYNMVFGLRRPIVKGTGLRIYKNFFGRTNGWNRVILNHFHSWLELIRHLLLQKILFMEIEYLLLYFKLFKITNYVRLLIPNLYAYHFSYHRLDQVPQTLRVEHLSHLGYTIVGLVGTYYLFYHV